MFFRITRQLTRNISIKTPRRLPASAKRQFGAQPPQPPSTPTSHRLQVPIEMDESQTTDMYLIPSPRRSMLGSFLGVSHYFSYVLYRYYGGVRFKIV